MWRKVLIWTDRNENSRENLPHGRSAVRRRKYAEKQVTPPPSGTHGQVFTGTWWNSPRDLSCPAQQLLPHHQINLLNIQPFHSDLTDCYHQCSSGVTQRPAASFSLFMNILGLPPHIGRPIYSIMTDWTLWSQTIGPLKSSQSFLAVTIVSLAHRSQFGQKTVAYWEREMVLSPYQIRAWSVCLLAVKIIHQ